ncbi:pyridoxal-phosphate dependent enzyme [Saprospira sp. CCB-QB6]|uniref:threonine ammonia-lyase n=1 Tax=Saprospira sp. CCB-QB6 TaxID=3023936 RepID=UPI00234A0B09|nr:pyridoxal-phosphate dependent enzyme [Saprospira sp. CCB-QB6]WCL81431.1 pyridoxal-phosphate dependent enzyme [Saprospira sp. CCB-QB6]
MSVHLPAILSAENIRQRQALIQPYLKKTPLLQSEKINALAGCKIYFKCENFQYTGSFKLRGALSAALLLSEEERKKGFCTHSSGNHAQAIAKAAQMLACPAYIVMPENAPAFKQRATAELGAEIRFSPPTTAGREAALAAWQKETAAYFIHPYNDYDVILGQASCSLEILEELSDLDGILAPIGGGGLLSGSLLSAHYFRPGLKVLGAEPQLVNDAYLSLAAGKIIENKRTDTLADGLRTTIRPKTFGVFQELLSEIICVEEEEIILALRLIWEQLKIVVEPSSAVPLAALLKHKARFKEQNWAIILSGGNVDLDQLPF